MRRLPAHLAFVVLACVTVADAAGASPDDGGPTFDRRAAADALTQVDLSMCRTATGPRGDGHVIVTFVAAGHATSAYVDRGPLAGSRVAKCIASQFAGAKVQRFSGPPVRVGKLFQFE